MRHVLTGDSKALELDHVVAPRVNVPNALNCALRNGWAAEFYVMCTLPRFKQNEEKLVTGVDRALVVQCDRVSFTATHLPRPFSGERKGGNK